jgi:hypothetical protein
MQVYYGMRIKKLADPQGDKDHQFRKKTHMGACFP